MQEAPVQELPVAFSTVRHTCGRKGCEVRALPPRRSNHRAGNMTTGPLPELLLDIGVGPDCTGAGNKPFARQSLRGAFHHRAGWNEALAAGGRVRKGREGGGADLRHAKSGSWGGSWAFRRTQARWKKDPEATLKKRPRLCNLGLPHAVIGGVVAEIQSAEAGPSIIAGGRQRRAAEGIEIVARQATVQQLKPTCRSHPTVACMATPTRTTPSCRKGQRCVRQSRSIARGTCCWRLARFRSPGTMSSSRVCDRRH